METGGKAVLVVDVHMGIGNHACHRHAADFFQNVNARLQNGTVSPELVDDGAFDALLLLGLQQGDGAVQLGKHAAPVDVTHQQHRGIHQFRQPHVHNVRGFQIDFCRASGTLNHNDVILLRQGIVRLHHSGDKFPLAAIVFHGTHIALHLTVDNHLTAHVRGGLEQNGVHPYIRLNAGCLGLHHLRPSHFRTGFGDEGVQRHVLTFEGGDPIAVLLENAAQSRRQQALAGIGHGALNHDVLSH